MLQLFFFFASPFFSSELYFLFRLHTIPHSFLRFSFVSFFLLLLLASTCSCLSLLFFPLLFQVFTHPEDFGEFYKSHFPKALLLVFHVLPRAGEVHSSFVFPFFFSFSFLFHRFVFLLRLIVVLNYLLKWKEEMHRCVSDLFIFNSKRKNI
jgi:hypothetical protein